MNNKYFLCILLILSGDISLNSGPIYNNHRLGLTSVKFFCDNDGIKDSRKVKKSTKVKLTKS